MSQAKKSMKGQPRYALATKQSAVSRVESGARVSVIASELGCRPGRIYYWLEQWRSGGGEWPEQHRRRRRRPMPPPGSSEREAALERLLGRKQAEVDFFREALRQFEQVRRPSARRGAPSLGTSSGPARSPRKAG
jgi:transposase-like protein